MKKSPKKKAAEIVPQKAYLLRTCNADMTSYNGFRWPQSGTVSCPDWSPKKECGNGLHGLLGGRGDGSLLNWAPAAKWLVVEVDSASVVDLGGKVKVPSGKVIFCGDRIGAVAKLIECGCPNENIVGGTATAGDGGTATAGDNGTATAGVGGTATAGDNGTATAGVGGTATAGDGGTATAGVGGTATAGYRGTATAGYGGTATAGYRGTATAGYRGTATAGDNGTATAGVGGTATAGDNGTATAGDGGTATAGVGGALCITYWCGKTQRYRMAVGAVGEGGLKPNTKYRIERGAFVEVKS